MRELKYSKKYKHFKGKEYFVLGKSTPLGNVELFEKAKEIICINSKHTEQEYYVVVIKSLEDELYYHSSEINTEELVVYMDDEFYAYVRPYDIFMSEVDKEKYPDIEQKYRFEEMCECDENELV